MDDVCESFRGALSFKFIGECLKAVSWGHVEFHKSHYLIANPYGCNMTAVDVVV